MAFENVVFPYYPMKHNISKSIIDPVSVVSNGNREYRIKRQAWERYEWTLPVQTMTNEQKEDIKGFLLQRQHSLNSFKFVDPDYATWDIGTRLSYNSLIFWNINLPASRTNLNIAGTHPIFNSDAFTVTINGNPDVVTAYEFPGGVPVARIPAAISTDIVEINSNSIPYFTVRLASSIGYTLAALDTNNETLGVNHAEIKLIEVFGEY